MVISFSKFIKYLQNTWHQKTYILMIHTQYTYIIGKYKIYLKQVEKRAFWSAFLSWNKRLQMNFIFSDNVRILYLSCNVNEPKITAKLSKKSRNKHPLNCFWWCPLWSLCLYCYHFVPLLSMNQVPEKLYLGQWSYIRKNYPVNAIWLLK